MQHQLLINSDDSNLISFQESNDNTSREINDSTESDTTSQESESGIENDERGEELPSFNHSFDINYVNLEDLYLHDNEKDDLHDYEKDDILWDSILAATGQED